VAPRARSSPGRLYRGLPAEDRDVARRERLLEAGLEEFGTVGFTASAIESLCARAGVATRSFYEHFESKEDLLIAVQTRIVDALAAEVVAALGPQPRGLEDQVSAGVDAFVRGTVRDLRAARVQLIEVVGVSARVERHRRETLHSFAAIIERDTRRLHDAGEIRRVPDKLVVMGLVGATTELMVDWMYATRRPAIKRVIDALVSIYLATLRS
jgi:AcrR family transcriptional regulator